MSQQCQWPASVRQQGNAGITWTLLLRLCSIPILGVWNGFWLKFELFSFIHVLCPLMIDSENKFLRSKNKALHLYTEDSKYWFQYKLKYFWCLTFVSLFMYAIHQQMTPYTSLRIKHQLLIFDPILFILQKESDSSVCSLHPPSCHAVPPSPGKWSLFLDQDILPVSGHDGTHPKKLEDNGETRIHTTKGATTHRAHVAVHGWTSHAPCYESCEILPHADKAANWRSSSSHKGKISSSETSNRYQVEIMHRTAELMSVETQLGRQYFTCIAATHTEKSSMDNWLTSTILHSVDSD